MKFFFGLNITKTQWKIIFLSSLGGALEFYDFILFAIFAVNIGDAFFPTNDALSATLHAFAVFAIGYLVRPIGGIFLSHFGDRYSRKNIFLISMVIMAFATFLIALLPGYQTWGASATAIFVLLRLCQGIAIGGEIPGAITFVKEHIEKHSGLACGIIFTFINLGIFLANFAYGVLNTLTTAEYAWRIAFLIGGALAILSYFLRKTLYESREFQEASVRYALPFLILMKKDYFAILRGCLIVAFQAVLVSLAYLYIPSFMKLHGYTHETIAWVTTINLAIFSFGCAFWGFISDFVGAPKVMILGALLCMPLVLFFYQSLLTQRHVMLSYAFLSCVSAAYTGAFSAYLASMFRVNVRFSGVAFTYNVGFAVFGGLSPWLATYLINAYRISLMPAYLFIGIAILGIFGVALPTRVTRDTP